VEQALPLSLPVRRLFRRLLRLMGGGELASILALYWQQVDEFNDAQHISDEESDAHAAATYEATLRRVIGMPARTSNDALAALDWLSKESEWNHLNLDQIEWNDNEYGSAVVSLAHAIRGYIAST
jgi:hypothetical protein